MRSILAPVGWGKLAKSAGCLPGVQANLWQVSVVHLFFNDHKKLTAAMIYAWAHDHTVEADCFAAMRRVEQRLELIAVPPEDLPALDDSQREQLLALTENLAEPDIDLPQRLEIVGRMRSLLNGKESPPPEPPDNENRKRQRGPPSPAFLGVETVYPISMRLSKCHFYVSKQSNVYLFNLVNNQLYRSFFQRICIIEVVMITFRYGWLGQQQ